MTSNRTGPLMALVSKCNGLCGAHAVQNYRLVKGAYLPTSTRVLLLSLSATFLACGEPQEMNEEEEELRLVNEYELRGSQVRVSDFEGLVTEFADPYKNGTANP